MEKKNIKNELVIMAPTQIKPDLSVGNIFDLTLIDFYVKARRLSGINVFSPFLWNINGEPIVKQILENKKIFSLESASDYIFKTIEIAKIKLKEHYINFDIFLRDDQILSDIEDLIAANYSTAFNFGFAKLSRCSKCEMIFGSDPSIKICKFCGAQVDHLDKETFFKKVDKEKILDKVNQISFYPAGTKQKLLNFIDTLPEEYNLILEKDRAYTLKYKNIKLDPRFVIMLFPAILKSSSYDYVTWIHGDIVKKFDYYSLCYLNKEDCPDKIVSHGLVLGVNNKKDRWQNSDNTTLKLIDNLDYKILRAYFLKHNIHTDIVINLNIIRGQEKGLQNLYFKINRVLEERNLDLNINGVRDVLKVELESFHKNIEIFRFSEAFNNIQTYTNLCWKIVKDYKLSKEEQDILLNFKIIYFGE